MTSVKVLLRPGKANTNNIALVTHIHEIKYAKNAHDIKHVKVEQKASESILSYDQLRAALLIGRNAVKCLKCHTRPSASC